MQLSSIRSTLHGGRPLGHNCSRVDAALLKPLRHPHYRQLSFHVHVAYLSSGATCAGPLSNRGRRHTAQWTTCAATHAHAASDPIARIHTSLDALQQLAANLDADPSTDGLLTAYQQLCLIQKQALQEQRKCQAEIARSKWRSSYRTVKGLRSPSASPKAKYNLHSSSDDEEQHPSASQAHGSGSSGPDGSSVISAELQELKQVRQKCDDAQDYLVGLIQAHLEDQPPSGATRLLTAAAFRQLNVAAINRTCINTFLEKQADASPADMAALMTALALVRCCSKASNEVEGFGRGQLAALFGGTMTHLIAHVERALQSGTNPQQQFHQLQQRGPQPCAAGSGTAATKGRRRRSATAASSKSTATAAGATAAQATETEMDPPDLQRQVAAGVAAHVTGRVPLNSALIPHILQLLGDQAPKWLHPITELQSAASVSQLQNMISHPSRYDYTYLAAALHRLSELVDQQHQQLAQLAAAAEEAVVTAAPAELAQASRLARKLYGRLQQLQDDATSAEIVCVLAAAAKMGVVDGKVYATASTQFVDGAQLQQANDAQIASVMYAVACFSSNSGGGDGSFSKQQQHHVLKQCTHRLGMLIQQQSQAQASSSNAAITAAIESRPEPANAVMALWALATTGIQMPRVLTNRLFGYLAEPSTVEALLGASNSCDTTAQQHVQLQEASRTSCTVLWAAAQLQLPLQQQQYVELVDRYLAAFVRALPIVPVPCTSVTTVLQSLAALLASRQQQQGQGSNQPGQDSSQQGPEADNWRSGFLRCSNEVIHRLQQQQHPVPGASSAVSSDCQEPVVAAAAVPQPASSGEVVCSVTAACQLAWAHQVAGIPMPDAQLMSLLTLLGEQTPPWILATALARAGSPAAITSLLQSPAAAGADLLCIAAAFKRLVELQQAMAASLGAVGGSTAAAGPADRQPSEAQNAKRYDQQVKECARQVSAFAQAAGIPDQQQLSSKQQQEAVQGMQQQQGQQQATNTTAAVASAAATVLWSTAQLQHRDTRLCSSCMQMFHAVAQSAAAKDAGAVVNAMAAAGRKLPVIYKAEGLQMLQEVVAACADKLLAAPLAIQALHAGGRGAGSNGQGQRRVEAKKVQQSVQQAMFTSGDPEYVVLAQNVLQLHAVLGMHLSHQQLQVVLAAVADEAALSGLKDNAATAALVASLSALAEISQQIQPAGDDSSEEQVEQAQELLSAGVVAEAAYEQQQLLQELLMCALLPRLATATPKQVANSLEAVAELAVGPAEAATVGATPVLGLALARDFARAVFSELLSTAAAGTAENGADSDTSTSSTADSSFLLGWKGEHVATVAVAAMRLNVAWPAFFAAVEADLLIDGSSSMAKAPASSQQQHRRRSRVQNVQLQHLVTLCCSAAALQCRVKGLLAHAFTVAQAAAQAAAQATAATGSKQQKQQTAAQQKQQQGLDLSQALLLAWCASLMDVPKLQQQAKELVVTAAGSSPVPSAPKSMAAQHRSSTTSAAAVKAATGPKLPDQVVFATPGLAARLFQLHVWLADRQVQAAQQQQHQQWLGEHMNAGTAADAGSHPDDVAGETVQAAEVEFGLGLGLSDILSPEQLQRAGQQWSQMQVAAAAAGGDQQLVVGDWRLAAVAEALQQLPGVEGLSAVTATADGWVRTDLEARIRGIPVAVLLVNDSDEEHVLGGATYAARHLLCSLQQEQQGPGASGTAAGTNESPAHTMKPTRQQQRRQQEQPAVQHDAHSAPSASITGRRPLSSYELLQECLAYEHVGDVMFRARALAARGYWVAVVSWQEWSDLGGEQSAELAYLQDKMWLLLQDTGGVQDRHRVSVGMPVAAAAAVHQLHQHEQEQ